MKSLWNNFKVVEVVYGIPIWHKGGKIIENAVE